MIREIKDGLTKELLNDYFRYEDGKLYHKVSNSNNSKIGERAGTNVGSGYREVSVNGKKYREHRIIYLMHYGRVSKYIDHKDMIRNNNKIENLRECTNSENMMNTKAHLDSEIGIKGLCYYDGFPKPWRAQMSIKGKTIIRKRFLRKENAVYALGCLRSKHHREFARS